MLKAHTHGAAVGDLPAAVALTFAALSFFLLATQVFPRVAARGPVEVHMRQASLGSMVDGSGNAWVSLGTATRHWLVLSPRMPQLTDCDFSRKVQPPLH